MEDRIIKLLDVPEGSTLELEGERLTFHHIDGMYSFSTNDEGKYINLKFDTPFVKEGDVYVFTPSD